MLVQRANMFLNRNSFKTIQDIIQRLAPECSNCFCKMKYFCVEESCIHEQPVCLDCSKSHNHPHFLHHLNRLQLLHLDKEYLPRQVDAFKKKHQEVKQVVESNQNAYLEVIQEYTCYIKELKEYMEGLQQSLEKSIKNTEVFVQLDSILEKVLTDGGKLTVDIRKRYWKLLKSIKFQQAKYDLLPDKYTVLGIGRIRRQIQSIIQKYASLTFQEIVKKEHMGSVFDYDELHKSFITNVFGNLQDRTLRTCDQLVDPQVVKNLARLIVQQMGYLDQQDLPHSIKQLQYENFDCSQQVRFPQKLQSLILRIKFDSHSTFRFNNYLLKDLRKLKITKQNYCVNTFIDYGHIKNFTNLVHFQVYDDGMTDEIRMFLYQLAKQNGMRVLRIGPNNLQSLECLYRKYQMALVVAQRFAHTKVQYLTQKTKAKLLEYILG